MNQEIKPQELLNNGYELVVAESPSNIALVKYWGKLKGQIPMNPSISYTLDKCKTTFEVYYKKLATPAESPIFYFEGLIANKFAGKTLKLIDTIASDFKELRNYHLVLNSRNSFPHSSGIASSASSMSALAFCLMDILEKSSDTNLVSYYARLGSGSACRSVFSPMASWGKIKNIENTSDKYATKISDKISTELRLVGDTIVLVHEGEKAVSSTDGHALMNSHHFRENRIKNAHKNYLSLINALELGDIDSWGQIIESEALELHAMMMTSDPAYLLMKPMTLEVIEKVRQIRKEHSVNTFFTLDAGPNVHILYPLSEKDVVIPLLKKFLSPLKMIHDQVGKGTKLIKSKKC